MIEEAQEKGGSLGQSLAFKVSTYYAKKNIVTLEPA